MGKIGNTWELVKQSFAILRDDEELMLLPVLSAISCMAVTASLLAGSGFSTTRRSRRPLRSREAGTRATT